MTFKDNTVVKVGSRQTKMWIFNIQINKSNVVQTSIALFTRLSVTSVQQKSIQ